MSFIFDEGFTDEDSPVGHDYSDLAGELLMRAPALASVQQCEEFAFKLLSSLPRSRLATIQRRIAPLLQFDVVGSLPAEVSLQIFSHLSAQTLLTCSFVSRRWCTLSNDPSLWKELCRRNGWAWKQPAAPRVFGAPAPPPSEHWADSDDEGMGDSDAESDTEEDDEQADADAVRAELTQMHAELDSGFASTSSASHAGLPHLSTLLAGASSSRAGPSPPPSPARRVPHRHSAPSALPSAGARRPDYKLLHQTHMRLRNRFLAASYRVTALQTRGAPANGHTNTIYCLQLYTYPSGVQTLFTGSRDRTVREWNLSTGSVERVISGVHECSVLSICVHNGYLASAGSDRRVAVWDLEKNELFKMLYDHGDSVLCVRFDDKRLVSCSKDRTVRTYTFPDLKPQFVLGAHRAAVNAVSVSDKLIVSASGDRSIRLWDVETGNLLRTFEGHHSRGIASIDFRAPYVLSGSSDKHLRLVDVTTLKGWSTSPDYDYGYDASEPATLPLPHGPGGVCQACGGAAAHAAPPELRGGCVHGNLVRSVALGDEFVVSGSYDLTVKVWDRATGALVADLTDGHTGRIFSIGFDRTKIISCGEDQRICIWDFSYGIDTSFIQL